jgi:tRNA threonylcarbamoyladenosine biosynthesis protein TsaE
MHLKFELPTEESTQSLAHYFSKMIQSPCVLGLKGEIGMGKTCFIRAMLQALGVQTAIKSPTFNLVESYHTSLGAVHHFDLYRLSDEYELEDLGFRDYLAQDSICGIEWPENAPSLVPFIDIMIEFSYGRVKGRQLMITFLSARSQKMLEQMEAHPWLER